MTLLDEIRATVRAIDPWDDLEREHRDEVLAWLAATDDVFRRVDRPVAPAQHLVSYFLLADVRAGGLVGVLLGDHLKSGLWLPSGGHVEPGESPAATVHRECLEELGVPAVFLPQVGPRPVFVTVTDTVGSENVHRDVSLWYVLSGRRDQPLHPDPREYAAVCWWSPEELEAADPARFDPHQARMLSKLGALLAG